MLLLYLAYRLHGNLHTVKFCTCCTLCAHKKFLTFYCTFITPLENLSFATSLTLILLTVELPINITYFYHNMNIEQPVVTDIMLKKRDSVTRMGQFFGKGTVSRECRSWDSFLEKCTLLPNFLSSIPKYRQVWPQKQKNSNFLGSQNGQNCF